MKILRFLTVSLALQAGLVLASQPNPQSGWQRCLLPGFAAAGIITSWNLGYYMQKMDQKGLSPNFKKYEARKKYIKAGMIVSGLVGVTCFAAHIWKNRTIVGVK